MANRIIEVRVDDKIASVISDPLYVCGNSDYVVKFAFDDEWADHTMKTARFIKSNNEYFDVVFNGIECAMPIIDNTSYVKIGVYAGNLCTTTAAIVNAQRSILCGSGVPAEPDPDVYAQILERIDGLGVPDLNRRVDALQSNAVIAQHVSGDMLHIEDAASWPVEKLVIDIEPKQEGSGDPSPDNVRAISGWDSVKAIRTGGNLLDLASMGGTYVNGAYVFTESITKIIPLPIGYSGKYTITADIEYNSLTARGLYLEILYTDGTKDAVGVPNANGGSKHYQLITKNNVERIMMTWGSAGIITTFRNAQIELGTTTTAYEPYQGTEYTAQFGQTIYGGTLDWKTGKLTKAIHGIAFTGAETFAREAWCDYGFEPVISTSILEKRANYINTNSTKVLTNNTHFANLGTTQVVSGKYGDGVGIYGESTWTKIFFRIPRSVYGATESNTNAELLTLWKNWLAAQYAAGTPLTVAYDLYMSEEIQLTPQQMPELLKGVNNVWCDTGETEMVYIADNQLYIDQKIGASTAALNALMEGINNA